MNVRRSGTRHGFSIVDLLAVVMILSTLSGILVPVFLTTRQAAAARACKANLAMIAIAESAYALRNGNYTTDPNAAKDHWNPTNSITTGLVGAPEGLSYALKCPLDGTSDYVFANGGTINGVPQQTTFVCPNYDLHRLYLGSALDYEKTLKAPVQEAIP